MNRTKYPQTNNSDLQALDSIVGRAQLASALFGKQYGGDRDVYEALGYSKKLTFVDFYHQYRRQDIASAIIDRPVSATWNGPLVLKESLPDEDRELNENTVFEQEWEELEKRVRLKANLVRLDKLIGIGHFAVLFLGFDDVKDRTELSNPIQGTNNSLLYIRPISENNVSIESWETDSTSERYGFPKIYKLTILSPGSRSSQTISVHHSRVIHVADGLLEGSVIGTSRLEAVFNRLKDLEKLVGGSAEMFWRGARPGYAGNINPEVGMDEPDKEKLRNQLDEYDHNLRRFLVSSGVDISSLETQVADPGSHVDVQIQMISAKTGIPKRILTGSERGELASTQDKDSWLSMIDNRREEFADPFIIRPLVDRLIEYGVLHVPSNGYTVDWRDLWSTSDKEKAEIGSMKTKSLSQYVQNPYAMDVLPPKYFYRYCLGLSDDEINEIAETQEQAMNEDQNNEEEIDEDFEQGAL